jgi:cyclophilin family peptidyl-prolyl cis-trans isomerase
MLALLVAGCASPAPPGPGAPAAGGGATFEGARFATEAGELTMVFFPEDAPQTVELYRAYLREGYFVGKEFGRIVPGHVIQVLDAAGAAGSTATEDARRVPLEPSPRLNFTMGAVGISRADDPNSGGPEFSIMDFATSHLWGNYTIFGQLVAGIEDVHRIARAPALDTPRVPTPEPVPSPNTLLSDRTALDPVRITAAEAINVTLSPAEAARLPGRVGQNVRAGDLRYSLEWPADLAPGRASTLTWFLRPYNNTAPPDPATLTMRIAGPGGTSTPALRPHPDYDEILAWDWAPPALGTYEATLLQRGTALATIAVEV